MDKIQTLHFIEEARRIHESQMYKIEVLLSTKEIDNLLAVPKSECEFGKMLSSNEVFLRHILGTLFYENLDEIHSRWHSEYYKIYNIFFKKEKKGLLSKIMGSNKVSEMDIDKAKLYYSDLKITTAELIKVITQCQRRVFALSNSKFE
ncbi:MAG: hypothetical protein U9Q29_04600 [Campylobacterota bacterium]|nr:hypothetical protein [Campylobacterota bacterium]